MTIDHSYILDNATAAESQRLGLMSQILDPWTRTYLAALGLREGWRCLELGGGNGSMTQWLCEQVGASGSVLSVDINPKLIWQIRAENLTVRQEDVRTAGLPEGAFDLVMCRAMLHQIAEDAPKVLRKMAAAVKPGGWLFVCEPDFHLVRTCEPEIWVRAWEGILQWGRTQGVDWFIGRNLPAMVTALGFGVRRLRPTCRTFAGPRVTRCIFSCFLKSCAIGWLAPVWPTRKRSTRLTLCSTILAGGRSAGC